MPGKNTPQKKKADGAAPEEKKKCFVIMPIGDQGDTPAEHFTRVYEDVIIPACESVELEPHRADRTKGTNLIHLDILDRIIKADICVCDFSTLNPNVMFELGVRQAFDKPAVLIKDDDTRDVFDLTGLRHHTYPKNLRYDKVVAFQKQLAEALKATLEQEKKNISSSIISLMKIHSASLDDAGKADSNSMIRLVLSEINELKAKFHAPGTLQPSNIKGINLDRRMRDYSHAKRYFQKARLACRDEQHEDMERFFDRVEYYCDRYPKEVKFYELLMEMKDFKDSL